MAAVHALSNRLLLLIAIALQLPSDFFLQFYDKPMMYLRPLHYSPQVSLPEEVTTRLPHTALRMQMSYSIYIQQHPCSTAYIQQQPSSTLLALHLIQWLVSVNGLVTTDTSQL